MDANELLTSEILSNADIIATIYQIVKDAGMTAANTVRASGNENKLCVLIPNVPDSNRMTTQCANTTKYTAVYDANHLTIVGGAALNLYDYKLKELKARRQLRELKEYIKRKTADIDINWWPVVSTNNMIPTSASRGIADLVDNFVRELQLAFYRNTDYLLDAILPYLNGVSLADTLQIIVDYKHTRPAGVYNINIVFAIKRKTLKICDINVHDGGAGQRYDREGREITDLRSMIEDPTYCFPYPNHPRSISFLSIGEYYVAVPNLVSLVDQQLFAFSNLARAKQVKALVNYKRVIFIKRVLMSFQLQDVRSPNYQELMDIFGTNNPLVLLNALETMEELTMRCVNKHVEQIQALCMERKQENSPDEIVEDLCRHIRKIQNKKKEELEQIKRHVLEPLEKIHQQADAERWKMPSTIPFKKEFIALMKDIERIREEIEKETNIDMLRSYNNTRAFSELIQFTNTMKNIVHRRNEYRGKINKERQEYARRHTAKLNK
jgi:hypothetical protein